MRQGILAVSVAALLVVAGCAGSPGSTGDGTTATTTTPADVQQRAVTAMEDVDTYQMEFRMNLSANGRTLQMTQDGAFNRTSERARIDMNVYGSELTAYLAGTTMYIQSGGQWQTQDLSESNPWESGSGLARQRSLLDSGNVTVEGGATVDGVATTVLRVDVEQSALTSVLSQQGGNLDNVAIRNATYRMYVANETDRPRKVEMEMDISAGGSQSRATITIAFTNYDDPVAVTIPESAPTGDSETAA